MPNTICAATLIFYTTVHAWGQSPGAPAFEVATVKPNVSGSVGGYFRMGGAVVTLTNQTVRNLIGMFYQVADFQLLGGPNWLAFDHYDIEGKVVGDPSLPQRRLMVQALLQDRFKLAVHRETRELPVFELTLAKGGLKLRPLKEGECLTYPDRNNPVPAEGKTRMDYCGSGGFGRGMYEASNATMAELAKALSGLTGRTVIDKTGVAGTFRVHLTFVPDDSTPSQVTRPQAGGPDNSVPASEPGPNVFTAIQEQLGLKLESTKGPVEVLVIDHVERPSEN